VEYKKSLSGSIIKKNLNRSSKKNKTFKNFTSIIVWSSNDSALSAKFLFRALNKEKARLKVYNNTAI